MIDAFKFYQAVLRHVNTWQAGHMRPEDFVQWTQEASTSLFNKLFGGEWEKSSVVDSQLAKPFYRTKNITVTNSNKPYDIIKYPADFGYVDVVSLNFKPDTTITCGCEGAPYVDGSMKETQPQEIDVCEAMDADELEILKQKQSEGVNEFSFDKVTTDRWTAATTHPRRKPTFLKPKMCITEGGYKIAPKQIGVVVFNYLKRPEAFVFNYTLGANDSVQYGAATSLEWDPSVEDILVRLVGRQFAKFTGNTDLYQLLENEIKNLMP